MGGARRGLEAAQSLNHLSVAYQKVGETDDKAIETLMRKEKIKPGRVETQIGGSGKQQKLTNAIRPTPAGQAVRQGV